MKEAAGEANMTVITIVLIAIVLGVGTVIVNNLMSSTSKRSACQEIGGTLTGNSCKYTSNVTTGATATCTMTKCSSGKGYSCGSVITCPS